MVDGFQVITFLHTMVCPEHSLPFRTALVVCPLNTVLNWAHEFEKWLGDEELRLNVTAFSSHSCALFSSFLSNFWDENLDLICFAAQ